MKPDWTFFSKLDHNGGYLHKFPADSLISHDTGLRLIAQVGTLVESSFQHPRHICSAGSGAVQGVFGCFNKVAGAFYFCLSRASNPNILHRLSAVAGSGSRACHSQIKQVTSCLQHLAGLQFGSRIREERAIQMLLARLANVTFGQLWNDVEERQACNILMLAAASVIPPFENISPKMLLDSITLGKDGTQIREHMDQQYLEERRPGCSRVAVPRTILPEDVTEPTTGIKFPTLLEDNSNPTAEVLVGMGIRSMRIMRVKNLNIYAFGLYIQPDSVCNKLGSKYASVPAAELKDHPDFYEDLLSQPPPPPTDLLPTPFPAGSRFHGPCARAACRGGRCRRRSCAERRGGVGHDLRHHPVEEEEDSQGILRITCAGGSAGRSFSGPSPAGCQEGARLKTKAAGPRGVAPAKVQTKAINRIGLAPPPPSKATPSPPSVPSNAPLAPPPSTIDVDKVFDVESTTSYMDMLNESAVNLDAGMDAFDAECNVEEIDEEEEDEGDEEEVVEPTYAKQRYKEMAGSKNKDFQFQHCFDILQHLPKWKLRDNEPKCKKEALLTMDDEAEDMSGRNTGKPEGNKKAKERVKVEQEAASFREKLDQLMKSKEALTMKTLETKLLITDKKSVVKLAKVQARKELDIKMIAAKEAKAMKELLAEEREIMMMRTDGMDEDQLAWWKETKADIIARKKAARQARDQGASPASGGAGGDGSVDG
ncbi:hypothetical protein QYE76_025813 [Lolium multiflorum]|uniref:No apical meristem-associated C-terminal domain-containing protein n=1 Tax=Lolium multiflorum TaxID=4521 RepID=A0AAD8RGE3_LOLMU|nr:hypothetical protein QYE76_025813 [Lolium multiflorum]